MPPAFTVDTMSMVLTLELTAGIRGCIWHPVINYDFAATYRLFSPD